MKLVDDNKRIASEHLKAADKLIKAGDLDRASEEIAKARLADPRNLYILAYEERMQYVKEQEAKKKQEESKKEESTDQPQKVTTQEVESEKEKKVPSQPKSKSEKEGEQPPQPQPSSAPAGKTKGEEKLVVDKKIQVPLYEDFVVKGPNTEEIFTNICAVANEQANNQIEDAKNRAQEEYRKKVNIEIKAYESEAQTKSAAQIEVAVATFRKKLEMESQVKLESEVEQMMQEAQKMFEDRLMNLEDERELRLAESTKELFTMTIEQLLILGVNDDDITRVITGLAHELKISPEQTMYMKKKTQERFYMDAVEVAWSDGTVSLEESDRLAGLRERFGISAEEHFQIENQIRRKLLDIKR